MNSGFEHVINTGLRVCKFIHSHNNKKLETGICFNAFLFSFAFFELIHVCSQHLQIWARRMQVPIFSRVMQIKRSKF